MTSALLHISHDKLKQMPYEAIDTKLSERIT